MAVTESGRHELQQFADSLVVTVVGGIGHRLHICYVETVPVKSHALHECEIASDARPQPRKTQ